MIEDTITAWHQYIAGVTDDLAGLLADDVVFHSPIVFTPQRGKDVTVLYLSAAKATLGAGEFRYTKTVLGDDTAMLEFETTMDGKYVNGVDIITVNDAGLIREFRVMIRPLQAINLVHQQMGQMLAAMTEAS